jgi:P4 family phage/plasmid primase-like protien
MPQSIRTLIKRFRDADVFTTPATTSDEQIAKAFLTDLKTRFNENIKSAEQSLWAFNGDGIYHRIDDDMLRSMVGVYDGMYPIEGESPIRISSSKVESILKRLVCHPDIYHPGYFDDEWSAGLTVKNGYLEIYDKGPYLENHGHFQRSRFAFPYEWNEMADCPEWTDFLATLFAGDDDSQNKRLLLQQFVGACLVGMAPQRQKCLVLSGSGANGKSVFLDAITEILFPPDAVSNISPQKFKEPYFLAELSGKRLNAVPEFPNRSITDSATFKQVITGDYVTARDPYKKAFRFRPRCGHIFAVNELPSTTDNSVGYWRRFLIVEFNRNFENSAARIDSEELLERFRGEAAGILNWAVNGAVKCLQSPKYEVPSSHKRALGLWREEADQVADFVKSCCDRVTDPLSTPIADIFPRFDEWASATGRRSLSVKSLGKRLKSLGIPQQSNSKKHSCYALLVRAKTEWLDFAEKRTAYLN